MKIQKPTLNESGSVEMFFQNNSQMEEFKQRLKPSLLAHLRSSLGVESIDIVEQIVDSQKMEKPKLFSDNERFKQMSTRNPALLKLKNLFNLDFD